MPAERDPAGAAARRRAEIRAFARTHHPDVGGDPDVFAAGLRRLRLGPAGPGDGRRRAGDEYPGELTTHRRLGGVGLVIAWIRQRCWGGGKPPRVT
jgi:hypothetical protein